jgi:hypothetical protein
VIVPADSIRRALADVFARPKYRWTEGPTLGEWALDRWRLLQEWLQRLAAVNPALYRLVLGGLLLLLLLMCIHIAYVLWQVLRPSPVPPEVAAPAPLRHDARAARAQADALAAAGRYVEALAHRFVAALLELERVRAIAFHPAKTPAEYVGEARLDAPGRESFRLLVAGLYGHLFGARPCDARAYRAFGVAADELLRHVAAG